MLKAVSDNTFTPICIGCQSRNRSRLSFVASLMGEDMVEVAAVENAIMEAVPALSRDYHSLIVQSYS